MKKSLWLIFGVGVPLGLGMLFIKNNLNMSESQWIKFYMISALVALTVGIAMNLGSNFIFTKKINMLGSLLSNPKRIDEFILENQNILESMKSKNPQRIALVKLNLSAAYARKKDYQKARKVLEEILPQNVRGNNKAVYFINKSYTYFKLNMNKEAVQVLKEGEQSIKFMEEHPVLGGNIAVVKVVECCVNGKNEEGKILYKAVKERWSKVIPKEDLECLEKMIDKNNK